MAKRFTVRHAVTLNQQDNANTLAFDEQIDLAVLLSQRLQTNVRQGHVIKVHKLALGLTPSGGDLDTGFSVSGTLRWCPATKHSVEAWQMAFNTWRKQKQLKMTAVGQGVRYDDFELAFSSDYIDSRTSSMFTTGMGDGNSESLCIYGTSSSGVDLTLEDIYDSAQPQPSPSTFPLGGTVKESKFSAEFPPANIHNYGANWSTIVGNAIGDPDSGAAYNADPVYFQDSNSLCGVLVAKGYVLAEDVAGAIEDEMVLTLSITCEISTPLVYRRRSRSTSTKSKTTASSKRTNSSKR